MLQSKDLNKVIEANTLRLLNSINEKKEQWILKCITVLHSDVKFEKETFKDTLVKLVVDNSYKVVTIRNEYTLDSYYFLYSYDLIEEDSLKYLAKFTVDKEQVEYSKLVLPSLDTKEKTIDYDFQINYTLPTLDENGNILKTTLKFNNEN